MSAARPSSAVVGWAPGIGPRRGAERATEVAVGTWKGSTIIVSQDAVDHRALQGAAQDSADHLPKHVGATAKRSPRIIVTLMAGTIARTLEFTATTG